MLHIAESIGEDITVTQLMNQGTVIDVAVTFLAGVLIAGCATTGAPESMIHPDYSGAALAAERRLAIDHCRQENTSSEMVDYRNEVNTSNSRGLAQQGERVSQIAAFNEAVVACLRHNGWRFP